MPSIGPQIPPHLLAKRKRDSEDDESPKPSPNRSSSPDSSDKRRKVLGPALPPAPLDERPPGNPSASDSDDSSSDDDDFGPAPPPANGANTSSYEPSESKSAFDTDPAYAPAAPSSKPRRDEWMMVPPKADDLAARMDPSKQRARKFNSGKGARAPGAADGDNAIWTETPEQKRKRLADEVMGVAPAGKANVSARQQARDREAEETARRVREHDERHRGKSLFERHQASTTKEKEDDPSKRAFDREKDVAAGVRLGTKEKKEMLSKAADFGSRFERGSFL
ncbi:hypothetical protein BU16DRAFT_524630 [Lophium mytilinum]|uniref:DUF3752 domain-containing protein n=1 Tax=Lophium mytilinum TaxID=390894 RepID=A0A6A6R164_9PEZI|nr:hypothetical protein BU16DRAFT_524630 [Lophium mytilinum]